jgi:hypothetical protein
MSPDLRMPCMRLALTLTLTREPRVVPQQVSGASTHHPGACPPHSDPVRAVMLHEPLDTTVTTITAITATTARHHPSAGRSHGRPPRGFLITSQMCMLHACARAPPEASSAPRGVVR